MSAAHWCWVNEEVLYRNLPSFVQTPRRVDISLAGQKRFSMKLIWCRPLNCTYRRSYTKQKAILEKRITFSLGLCQAANVIAVCCVRQRYHNRKGSLLNLPAITIRITHGRPEGMDVGTLFMSGLKKERVLDAVCIISAQHRKTKPVMQAVSDYQRGAVSKKLLRIVLSYVDYVNRTVWHRA
jgi:hypothetical protein